MTPELIGILAVGATVIGLLVTYRRDARADNQRLRDEVNAGLAKVRADNQALRDEVNAGLADARADNQRLRDEVNAGLAEVRADNQRLRTEVRADFAQVRGDLADVRKDVQALTERVSRLEGVIEGLFTGRRDRDRHDDAA